MAEKPKKKTSYAEATRSPDWIDTIAGWTERDMGLWLAGVPTSWGCLVVLAVYLLI